MNKRSAILMAFSLFAASETYAQNGGTSCATATVITNAGGSYTADTTAAPNWMESFGPLVSPSNDVVYTVVYNGVFFPDLYPIASNYQFAIYLIPSCTSGAEPTPLRATATIGNAIDFSGLAAGTYYLAVTGIAAGGPGANGTVTFAGTPVTLQSFEVE